jgi:glycosyltransferase involved in cell wall biosynthesis
MAALVVARLRRKHFLMRVGGDYAWEQGVQRFGVSENLDEFVSGKFHYGFRVRLFRFLQSFIARRAEAIIVPSEYLKRIVLTWGVHASRIRVVYSAFIPEEIPEGKKDLGALFDMPGIALVSSARLVPWKGMHTLIELMPELQKDFNGIGLVILGDGPERTRLENIAKNAGVAGRVRFMGDVPHATALRYFKAADVFVLNTGYEGLSYTLLEVMAQGTPIVTTAVGGNPELIESGRDGILVQYDNKTELLAAIRGILSGSIGGVGLARAAQEKVKNFSEARMIDGTIAVLRSL